MIGTGIDAIVRRYGGKVKPKEYFLGPIDIETSMPLREMLEACSVTIADGELPIFTSACVESTTNQLLIKKYLAPVESGATYDPLGDFVTEMDMILIDTFLVPVDVSKTTFIDLGEVAEWSDYLEAANAEVRDLSDPNLLYYFRVLHSGQLFFYKFIGVNGFFGGDGQPHLHEEELEIVFPVPLPQKTQEAITRKDRYTYAEEFFSNTLTLNMWKLQLINGGQLRPTDHPDALGIMAIVSSAFADSGVVISTKLPGLEAGVNFSTGQAWGSQMDFILRFTSFVGATVIRAGFHDSVDTQEAFQGIYFKITGNEVFAEAVHDGYGTAINMGEIDLEGYHFRVIAYNGYATFQRYNLAGELLQEETINSNLPYEVNQPLPMGIVAMDSVGLNTEICQIDYMGFTRGAGFARGALN